MDKQPCSIHREGVIPMSPASKKWGMICISFFAYSHFTWIYLYRASGLIFPYASEGESGTITCRIQAACSFYQ
jgi:hypothetical protein